MIKKVLIIPYKIIGGEIKYFVGKRPQKDGWWQFPTGHVEVEKVTDAVMRELKEELGIGSWRNFINTGRSFNFDLEAGDTRVKKSGRKVEEFIFAVELPAQKIILEKREFSTYKFLDLAQAKKILTWPQHKIELENIDKIIKKKTYPKMFLFCGPSASGKESIIQEIVKRIGIKRSRTVTTRPIAKADNSKGRRFVSLAEFEKIDKQNNFIEKNFFHNNWYGSPKNEIEQPIESGFDIVAELDINGIKTFKAKYSNLITIFIKVDPRELAVRLERRGREDKKSIEQRMIISRRELKESHICDYIVENKEGKLNKAVGDIVKIIEGNKGELYEK